MQAINPSNTSVLNFTQFTSLLEGIHNTVHGLGGGHDEQHHGFTGGPGVPAEPCRD
jgi:hypothetical protein